MKKKILDVMIDFETFGRQPNSVPINLAVVAWDRYAEENPFVIPRLSQSRFYIWHFDICECLVEGMTIEEETQKWWMERPDTAREALHLDDKRDQCRPYDVMNSFIMWLSALKKETKADEICIWSQGSDFDIAKLRWLINKYPKCAKDAEDVLNYSFFRDARTVILEVGNKLFDGKRGFSVDLETCTIFTDSQPNKEDELYDFCDIYENIVPMEAWAKQLLIKDGVVTCTEGVMSDALFHLAISPHAHNSLYDCMRSIYNVWWLNKALDTQLI